MEHIQKDDIIIRKGILHILDSHTGYLGLSSQLLEMGPDIIVVTSVPDKEKDKDSNVIAYDRTCNTYWKIKCRYIPTFYPGTGDAYTSVMIGSLLDGDSLPIALDKGVQFITQAIKASYGFDYPNREGVLLERVLEVLKMPVVLGGYEMI